MIDVLLKNINSYYDKKIASVTITEEEKEQRNLLKAAIEQKTDLEHIAAAFICASDKYYNNPRKEPIEEIVEKIRQLNLKEVVSHDSIHDLILTSISYSKQIEEYKPHCFFPDIIGEICFNPSLEIIMFDVFKEVDKVETYKKLLIDYGVGIVNALIKIKAQSIREKKEKENKGSVKIGLFFTDIVCESEDSVLSSRIIYLAEKERKQEYFCREYEKRRKKDIEYVKSLDFSQQIDVSNTKGLESIDDEVKEIIYSFILEHNFELQKETIDELKKAENKTKLEVAFETSCFSYQALTEEQITNLNKKDLNAITKILTLFTEVGSFDDTFPIYDILMNAQPSVVSSILKSIKAGRISPEFVKGNPDLFKMSEDEYSSLNNNINYLKGKNIDTFTLSRSTGANSLLQDQEQLANTMALIETYGLDYSKANDFSLFEDSRLINIVDNFIELGLSSFIQQNSSYINSNSIIFIKRMQLCRMLGIDYIKDGNMIPEIKNNPFCLYGNIISNDDVERMVMKDESTLMCEAVAVINDTPIIVPERIELKGLEDCGVSYKIGDYLISKNKVLRNISALDDSDSCRGLTTKQKLYNAFAYNSALNDEELARIDNILDEKAKGLQLNRL